MGVHSIVDVARELVSWVNPDPGSLLVAVFYLDDSGTHAGSRVVVFGGLIGEQEQWEKFEPLWQAKLDNPLPGKPPLKRFHMHHCQRHKGEFIDYSDAESDALIHDFRQIILDCGVHGVCAGLSVRDYDELITGALRDRLGEADDMAFSSAISALDIDSRRAEGMTLICDNTGDKSTERYARMYDRYQGMFRKEGSRPLEGLAFRSMEKVLPLQGADMIAWETYFHACNVLKLPEASLRPHLERYVETGRFGALFLSRERILEYTRRLKRGRGVSWDWWATWPPS